MRKLVLITSLIAISGAISCTKTESVNISEGREIAMQNSYLTKTNIGQDYNVLGYTENLEKECTFLFNEDFAFEDGKPDDPTHKYYYNGDITTKYHFHAVSPSDIYTIGGITTEDNNELVEGHNPTIIYIGGTTHADAKATNLDMDLLIANHTETNGDNEDAETLAFKHALTKVQVTAVTDVIDVIIIKDITLKASHTKGTFNLTRGTFTELNCTPSEENNTSGTFTNSTPDNTTYLTSTETVILTPFYIVPQKLEHEEDKIIINYTVNGIVTIKTIPINALIFKSGKNLSINLEISPKEISFTTSASDWINETSINGGAATE